MAFQLFPFIIYGLLLTRYIRNGNLAFFRLLYIWIAFDKISSEWQSSFLIMIYGLILKMYLRNGNPLFFNMIYGSLLTRYLRNGIPPFNYDI